MGDVETGVALELRPPKLPAQMVLFVAGGSAFMAVGGIVTGQVLLGFVALLSAGWLASMAYVSLTAWSRLDDDGLRSHWMRATQFVRWDQMAEIEVDRRGPHGALRTIEAIRVDGAAARWAPWYPFLWYTHHSVSTSLPELERIAGTHDISVKVLSSSD